MTFLEPLRWVLEFLFLSYFAFTNTFYAFALFIGARGLRSTLGRSEVLSVSDLLEKQVYRPISLLVPAYNEQETIASSVRSFLNLHYPEFEVVVVNDGSKDDTMAVLKREYQLLEVPQMRRNDIVTKAVNAVYRSPLYPNLVVVDKQNGGKADALNVGLLHSRFPIFCALDADSLLDARALLRAARHFLEDDGVIAVGCNVRVLNGATVTQGEVKNLSVPKGWLERFQVLEYLRVFYSTRVLWDRFAMVLIISGAFGLFKRELVLSMGGYRTDTVGEDMELTVRLHRQALERGQRYAIKYAPDPVCWTQVPDDWKVLRRQRNRWHRGLWETLWTHRDMLFKRRYRSIGWVGLPMFWLLEAISPAFEVMGYGYVLLLLLLGQVNVPFATAFAALSVVYGMLLSLGALWAETFTPLSYPRLRDHLLLLVSSIFENLGYRQALAWERAKASFEVWRKRGQWGEMVRKKIGS
jgi:cellulose synthase/poly-beta-1,6-N-acetylglucosamine synthase-like glycosyltransferase